MSRNYRSIKHVEGGDFQLKEAVRITGAEVSVDDMSFTALLARLSSAARWIGPVVIYALQSQTISFAADEGTCRYSFNGQLTSAIAFDAAAADYQAAFEALSSVGVGKVVASGTPGAITLIFDASIIPTLITTGTKTLKLETVAAPVEIFIADADIDMEVYSPSDGDVISDALLRVVEEFGADAAATLTDDSGSHTFADPIGLLQDLFTSGGDRSVATTGFPFLSDGSALRVLISDAGGTGKTTGILKVWLCVATPMEA